MHLFKVLSQNVMFRSANVTLKRILHYKNILVSMSFEHVQYNE